MLLSASIALAENVTTSIAFDGQRWVTTWSDVGPGPLPSLVLHVGEHEVRIDLVVEQIGGVDLVIAFDVTEIKGKRGKELWAERIESHTERSAAIFASQGPDHQFQIVAAITRPEPLPDAVVVRTPIAAGALAGCEWTRQAEATVVYCPDAVVMHRSNARMDDAAIAKEAATTRDLVGATLIDERLATMDFDGLLVPAHRVAVRGELGTGLILTAWFPVGGGTDQVGCMCAEVSEDSCRRRMSAFALGAPADVRAGQP